MCLKKFCAHLFLRQWHIHPRSSPPCRCLFFNLHPPGTVRVPGGSNMVCRAIFSPGPLRYRAQSPGRSPAIDLYPPSHPPSISTPLQLLCPPEMTICRHWLVRNVDRLLIYYAHAHTHTHAQQSPHQVWLIWLVTHVSRAITGIQMFHSPFVCTSARTHTHANHTRTPAFILLPSPPVVGDVMRHVARCCFDYFSPRTLSSWQDANASHCRKKKNLFHALAKISSRT